VGAPSARATRSMSSGAARQRKRSHPVARIKGGWSAAEDTELVRRVTFAAGNRRRPGLPYQLPSGDLAP
jgi:hypothetical protein